MLPRRHPSVRNELRWAVAAIVALGVGLMIAQTYARLAAPYYAVVDRLVAIGHPWEVTSVEVEPGKSKLSTEVQLRALVRRRREDPNASARVIGRVQIGEVIETPLVFWTVVLMWPAASTRSRILRMLAAIPAFLALEAVTTAAQLILPMAQASAILAGDDPPLTLWDRWSQFLEAGGQFVLVLCGAITMCSITAHRSMKNGRRTSGHRGVAIRK
jgi:hypothetical protein